LHYATRFAVRPAGVRAILRDWVGQSDEELALATHGIWLSDEERRRLTELSLDRSAADSVTAAARGRGILRLAERHACHAEAGAVGVGRGRGHHLDGAARGAERHRPKRIQAAPVDQRVHLAGQERGAALPSPSGNIRFNKSKAIIRAFPS
jgi:hypothetical protein